VTFAYDGASPDAPAPRAGAPGSPQGVALENITLDVFEGERLGILGPNGGGKSTLLKLTLGLLSGHTGEIEIFGRPPSEARREGLIGYVPQRIEAELAFPLSVLEIVEMGASVGLPAWKRLPADRRAAVTRALDLVGARQLADRPIGRLSGGQLQRVMMARALAGSPKLLLLDEPTVGIDVVGQQQFADLLRTLHDALDVTIMVVSHDLRTVAAGCDRVACLSRTLHSHTDPRGLTPEVLAAVFRHDVAAIFGDLHVDAHKASDCHDEHHHEHGHDNAEGCSHGCEHDHATGKAQSAHEHKPRPAGEAGTPA
jgi:zinc transport system ATP-binding protein